MKKQIIKIIEEKGSIRPHELKLALRISAVAIHKHLRSLLEEGVLQRQGSPPRVFYTLAKAAFRPKVFDQNLDPQVQSFIQDRYLYISPSGHILKGLEAFQAWVLNTKQSKQYVALANEFVAVRKEADSFFEKNQSFIRATPRFQNIFFPLFLEEVYYQDFYSLPKFGKTPLGVKVLYAKQAQNRPLIQSIAKECQPVLEELIRTLSIDTIAWVPHSIPRQVPFLKEFQRTLDLSLPKIDLVKAYSGEIPVAQKSLSKLEERIENARDTLFVQKVPPRSQRVLLIDDAVGSGATLHEIAIKLKSAHSIPHVFGYAIVGSYKGFEVIREV